MEFCVDDGALHSDVRSPARSFFTRSFGKIGRKMAKKQSKTDLNVFQAISQYWSDTPMTSPGPYDTPSRRNTVRKLSVSSPLTPQSITDVPEFGTSPPISYSYANSDLEGKNDRRQIEAASPISITSLMNGFHQAESSTWDMANPKRLYSDMNSSRNIDALKCLKKRKWSGESSTDDSNSLDEFDAVSASCSPLRCTYASSHITEDALQNSLINCSLEDSMATGSRSSAMGNLFFEPQSQEEQIPDISFHLPVDFTSLSSSVSPESKYSPSSQMGISTKLSPIEQVQHDTKCFEGGDAVFTVAMDRIMCKMIIALGDIESVYLFRDFAGHFTTFLDRFGPGGYDSHRAPPGASWMLKLLLPWTYIDEDAKNSVIAVYEEVNGWIRNIARFINPKYSDAIFEEGTWDSCVEHMASSNLQISDIAYHTAKVIVTTLPFDHEIVCRVLLMRNVTLGYDNNEMSGFRSSHVRLMNRILERIDNMDPQQQNEQHKDFVTEINGELERLLTNETNSHIHHSIEQCLDYAVEIYRSMDVMKTNNPQELAKSSTKSLKAPRLSMNFDHWSLYTREDSNSTRESNEENNQEPKARRWHRFTQKLHKLFSRGVTKSSSAGILDISNPKLIDTVRISSPRSAYQKNWSNEEFNLEEVWGTKSLPL